MTSILSRTLNKTGNRFELFRSHGVLIGCLWVGLGLAACQSVPKEQQVESEDALQAAFANDPTEAALDAKDADRSAPVAQAADPASAPVAGAEVQESPKHAPTNPDAATEIDIVGSATADVGDDAAPTTPANAVALGPIEDEALRDLVYKALQSNMNSSQPIAEGAEEITELGDADTFKFAVVKISTSGSDAAAAATASSGATESGQGPLRAVPGQAVAGLDAKGDGDMEVQVTGWFKRSVVGNVDTSPTCKGFDAVVALERSSGTWKVKNAPMRPLEREDNEDCF